MSKYKTISSELIHENPWSAYKHDLYSLPDGSEGNYYYLDCPNIVMIIPILDDGRLLFVRQYRYLPEKFSLEFPCGATELNETPLDAAKRELLEETGYEADELMKVGVYNPRHGITKGECHVFLASGLKQIAGQKLDSSEEIEILPRRIDELENFVMTGAIIDGLTLAAWAMVRDRLRQSLGI